MLTGTTQLISPAQRSCPGEQSGCATRYRGTYLKCGGRQGRVDVSHHFFATDRVLLSVAQVCDIHQLSPRQNVEVDADVSAIYKHQDPALTGAGGAAESVR